MALMIPIEIMAILDMRLFQAVFEVVINFIDSIFFVVILCSQMRLKEWVTRTHIFFWITSNAVMLITYNYFTQNHVSSTLLASAVFIVFSKTMLEGKLAYKLFWIFYPLMLLFCIETLTISTILSIHSEPLTIDFAEFGLYRVLATMISKVFLFVILFFLTRYKLNLEAFGYKVLLILAALPVIWLFGLFSIYQSFVTRTLTDPLVLLQASIAVLLQSLLLLTLIIIINKAVGRNFERELLTRDQQQLNKKNEILSAVVQKFQSYQDSIDEITKNLWHSLKDDHDNSSRAIRIERSKEILAQIAILRESYSLSIGTGDDIIDVVITSASQRAKAKNITLKHEIDLPIGHTFDSSVIGGMLMHILDNAIETVGAITDIDGEKVIEVSLKTREKICNILVEYPADSLIEVKQLLAHQDTALRVVKGLTKRYLGDIHTRCEDYYFTVDISLPLDELRTQPRTEETPC